MDTEQTVEGNIKNVFTDLKFVMIEHTMPDGRVKLDEVRLYLIKKVKPVAGSSPQDIKPSDEIDRVFNSDGFAGQEQVDGHDDYYSDPSFNPQRIRSKSALAIELGEWFPSELYQPFRK